LPRKRKQKIRHAPNRTAPTRVTPFVGLGDVLRLVDSESWMESGRRTLYNALIFAAFAALAACARVRPRTAVAFLLSDYEAGRLTAQNIGHRFFPVILLPVAVEAIERYLEERRKLGIGGVHLFVDRRGDPIDYGSIYGAFSILAKRCGHPGGKILERLIEFHDLQLAEEGKRRKPDLAACVALRRGRRGHLDDDHAQADIDAAAADRARLATVLERSHVLAGPAGRWIGGHGRTKARETARLFLAPTRVLKLSPATRMDPACTRLLGLDWSKGKIKQRKKIVDEDLPHLVALLNRDLINRSDLRVLLNCSLEMVYRYVRRYRRSLETPEQRLAREEAEAGLRDTTITAYVNRPEGETLKEFHRRFVDEHPRLKLGWGLMLSTLQGARVMPAQIARKGKRRIAG
jgi:hypothetical protein